MNREDIERLARRFLCGRTWFIEDVPDEDVTFAPHDQGGFIMTKEEWRAAKRRIDNYYKLVTREEIERHNDTIMREHRLGKYSDLPREKTAVEPRPRVPKPGYIYLLHAESTPWYKIGISVSPKERKKVLSAEAPFRIVKVAYFDVDDMLGVEAWWHKTFAHKRVNGEWFELDESDINLFVAQEGKPTL